MIVVHKEMPQLKKKDTALQVEWIRKSTPEWNSAMWNVKVFTEPEP